MAKKRTCELCGRTYLKKYAKKSFIKTSDGIWICKDPCLPSNLSRLRIDHKVSSQARGKERSLGNTPDIQRSLKALEEASKPKTGERFLKSLEKAANPKKVGMTLDQRKEMKKVNPYYFANKLEILDAPPAAEGESIQYDYVKIRIKDPVNKKQMEILVRLDELIKNLINYQDDLNRRTKN